MLAIIIVLLGGAVFYATNRALPMLELSRQYAATTTHTQRAMIETAGQALLAVGQSHTPGTFLGFFLSEVAGIMMSIVMLQSHVYAMFAIVFLALYVGIRKANQGPIAIALTFALLGIGIFLATNNPFSMLSLSNQ